MVQVRSFRPAPPPPALPGFSVNDEGRFVVLVNFLAPVFVDRHRGLEPVEANLPADGDVIDAHGSSNLGFVLLT